MQKFNYSNTETLFIKNLLKNTYLPYAPTVRHGDYLIKGVDYCFGNNLIHCTESGTLTTKTSMLEGVLYVQGYNNNVTPTKLSPSVSDSAKTGAYFLCGAGAKTAKYYTVETINFNNFQPGINSNYVSNSTYYDSETHQMLGKYLRWYRDVYSIDLMSMYNCFCDMSTSHLHLTKGNVEDGKLNGSTVWVIPAQLNKTYTLFINSAHKVTIGYTFMNNRGRILNDNKDGYVDESLNFDITEYNELTYGTPIYYSTQLLDSNKMIYNNNFYIVVQVDSNYPISIVVLEGKYKRHFNRVVTNAFDRNLIQDYGFDSFLCPSLAISPTTYYIPYSNRLIEFLLNNVITPSTDISLNVKRIQEELNNRGIDITPNDVWSDDLRYSILNEYFKYHNPYYLSAYQLDDSHNPISIESIRDTNILVYSNPPIFEANKYYKYDTNTLNYNPLSDKPTDWENNYMMYFEKDMFDNYHEVKSDSSNGGSVVGLKNCKSRRTFKKPHDITGFIDKDVENTLFNYRRA